MVAAILSLAEKLCQPVGGILTNPVNYTGPTNNFTNSSSPPVPYTGEATNLQGSFVANVIGCVAVGFGVLLL